ncbi:MAG: hypothetical protein ACRD3O_03765 [Terriglobia bacterium]
MAASSRLYASETEGIPWLQNIIVEDTFERVAMSLRDTREA